MNCKKNVVWWLINGRESKFLEEKERTCEALMPLVRALFPGINFYSNSGFNQVMHDCVIPVLKKCFPELLAVSETAVSEGEIEISEFLPSNGYEWQESAEWRATFDKLLDAA